MRRIYVRRRIVAVIIQLLFIAAVVFVVISDVKFAKAVNAAMHPDEANAVTRSSVPDPDGAQATTRTAGVPDCTSSDITLGLSLPAAEGSESRSGYVAPHGRITFTAKATHTSRQNCLIDAAPDSEALVITDYYSGDVVYDSSLCDVESVYLLMRGSDEDVRQIGWNAYSQTTECVTDPGDDDYLTGGVYSAQLVLKGVDGVESQKITVYVTSDASQATTTDGEGDPSGSDSSSSVSSSSGDASSSSTSAGDGTSLE